MDRRATLDFLIEGSRRMCLDSLVLLLGTAAKEEAAGSIHSGVHVPLATLTLPLVNELGQPRQGKNRLRYRSAIVPNLDWAVGRYGVQAWLQRRALSMKRFVS